MKARLVALLLGLLLLPLGLALWLGLRSLQDDQASALVQARAVWGGVFQDLRGRVGLLAQGVEEDLRAGRAEEVLVRTSFLIEEGEVVSPARYQPDGSPEPFFDRTATLWERRFWERGSREGESAPTAGWLSWTTGEGPGFLYWWTERNRVRGVELDAWAFLSRLSAALPDWGWSPAEASDRLLVLRDDTGRTFAQWGRWESGAAEAVLTQSLPAPFQNWEVRLFLAPSALGDSGFQWMVLFALVGLGLAGVVGLGAWFLVRTLGASLAEAQQQVKFVNQVSHELKTPLTNILLYGELLENALGPHQPDKARDYLEVIRGESGRLGRLISNVLTFARRDQADVPRLRTLLWDEAVAAALKPFRPGLADRGMVLEWQPGAPESRGEWDPDWIGQMVGNLISNAEKYAWRGGVVLVSTGVNEGFVWVRVADRGPGIPAEARQSIFLPFARLDQRLTAQAAGTGLGLGIARDLARRHGGDLVVEPSTEGASFLLTLPGGRL